MGNTKAKYKNNGLDWIGPGPKNTKNTKYTSKYKNNGLDWIGPGPKKYKKYKIQKQNTKIMDWTGLVQVQKIQKIQNTKAKYKTNGLEWIGPGSKKYKKYKIQKQNIKII